MATNLSGSSGTIKIGGADISEIRNWSFTTSAANPQFATNASGGFKKSVAGVKSGRGTFQYVLDTEDPITDHFDEGDEVTLLLHLDATHAYSVPARIESIGIEVDIDDTGQPVGGPVEFTSSGAWTKPTYT